MTTWLRSTWLDLAIVALIAAAEAATLAPWLHLLAKIFGHPGAAIPSPIGIALFGLISFWATRTFMEGGWDVGAARGMSLGLWLLLSIVWFGVSGAGIAAPLRFVEGIFSLDPGLYALLAVGALAWWRGMSIGSEPEPFTGDLARGVLMRGVPVIAAALVIGALMGAPTGPNMLDSAAVALPVLLICGLSAAAAVQVRQAQTRVKSGSKRAGLGWVGAALGLSAGIVLLGLILATIAGPDVWASVLNPLGVVFDLIESGLYYILIGIAYVVFLILWPFIWIFQHLSGEPPKQQEQQNQPGGQNQPKFEQQVHQILPTWAIHAIEIALLAALIAVVLWLVFRSMRRYRKEASDAGTEEIRESVWSKDLAMDQLRGWLKGLRPRRAAGPRLTPWDVNAAPATVRDAYRHVLVLAARRGSARVPAESANDYAGRVGGSWQGARDPLDDLTRRYLDARYGEHDSDEDIRLARQDWEAIRAYLRRQGESSAS